MQRNTVFAVKLPGELKKKLSAVCDLLGMRKSFVVEDALREKIEDLMDGYDLQQAIKESSGFHSWDSVKKEIR